MGIEDVKRKQAEERDARKAEGKSNFNADKTRYISREFLGWVCYEGAVDAGGDFRGKRVGVTTDVGDADRWLNGEEIRWDIPADVNGNLVEGR